MRRSRHASTLFSALAAIGYANRPRPHASRPQAEHHNGGRRIPPMLDSSWDDEDVPYDIERSFPTLSSWED